MKWKIRGHHLNGERTLLMGVLNVTPDSFSDGGRYLHPEQAIRHAIQLVAEGADILDLGGESTRPGASSVSADQEKERILPVLRGLRGKIQIPISIDTTKPEVARLALEEGARIINDVSGLKDSGVGMAHVVRDFGAGLVLMHRRGNPETMQAMTDYRDVVAEVLREIEASVKTAVDAGISEEQLVVDPGLGFAKTAEQNLELIRHLEKFQTLGLPVLLGPSRKSFVGKVTERPMGDREYGTAAIAAAAVFKGVSILRVHEVGAMRDAVRMAEAIRGEHHVRAL